jgi:hypothetical protein
MSELSREQVEELFGSDDQDSDDSIGDHNVSIMHDSFTPAIKLTSEKFDRIPGLRLLRQGLSHRIQTRLLDTIIEANYFNNATTNQAMHFGDLPKAFEDIGTWAREDTDLLVDIDRDRLFDQAILNLYRPGKPAPT